VVGGVGHLPGNEIRMTLKSIFLKRIVAF
jgi:hypothetical protein